jgi:molybdopterin molybdotransferase
MSGEGSSAKNAHAGLLSYAEAAAVVTGFARGLRPGAVESVALASAQDRVLAKAIVADVDQPAFPRSTRDGYACRAVEAATHDFLPVAGATHAGEAPPPPLPPKSMWEIMTGAPVGAGADAVVMVEHVERNGVQARLLPPRVAKAGENIVARGEQARAGDELVSAGTLLGPAQIALAAACGYANVDAYPRPRVAILTTGDELVPVDAVPGPGQIRNSNGPMLETLVRAAGGDVCMCLTATDTAESLDFALTVAGEADLLLISGGVSAGKFDLVEPALARIGAKFHFTGVRMQPGKPLVFGALRASTLGADLAEEKVLPFFGLPGNPISSAATFLLFAAPVIAALSGSDDLGPRFIAAELKQGTDRRGNAGLTRFLPSWCEFDVAVGKLPQVATVPWHGSGDLPAFARSNCFLVVPEGVASLEAGAQVSILMM